MHLGAKHVLQLGGEAGEHIGEHFVHCIALALPHGLNHTRNLRHRSRQGFRYRPADFRGHLACMGRIGLDLLLCQREKNFLEIGDQRILDVLRLGGRGFRRDDQALQILFARA